VLAAPPNKEPSEKSRFLKKVAQKLSGIRARGFGGKALRTQIKKSFLLLFYKKAVLPSLNSPSLTSARDELFQPVDGVVAALEAWVGQDAKVERYGGFDAGDGEFFQSAAHAGDGFGAGAAVDDKFGD
jgi:hypothetical protein